MLSIGFSFHYTLNLGCGLDFLGDKIPAFSWNGTFSLTSSSSLISFQDKSSCPVPCKEKIPTQCLVLGQESRTATGVRNTVNPFTSQADR